MPTNAIAGPTGNELIVRNRHPRWRVDRRRLRQIALAALTDPVFATGTAGRSAGRWPARPSFRVAFFLVAAEEMARLNETHLGHSGSTDVITFDYGPPPLAAPGTRWLCGDVFICLDDARQQARRFRSSWPAEVVRYAVHALLHLAGFDDRMAAARRRMKREEDRLVKALFRKHGCGRLGVAR